jgi:hypothetical protein
MPFALLVRHLSLRLSMATAIDHQADTSEQQLRHERLGGCRA